jgi:hypothetical protein
LEEDSGLRRIEEAAFEDCGGRAIGMPGRAEAVGERCFCEPKLLDQVGFEGDSALRTMRKSAFSRCGRNPYQRSEMMNAT